MNSLVIGLTGGIGSGKSTVAKLFQQHGVDYVDADDVARQVVLPGSPCLQAIEQRYGPNVIEQDGTLNRRQLREIVFANPEERLWLESQTHPAIRQNIEDAIMGFSSPYGLLVHPLLFEKGQNTLCQYTVAISVDRDTQIRRVISRDTSNQSQVEQILDAQMSNDERCKLADFVLDNSGLTGDLSGKVIDLHNKLLELTV